MVLCIAHGMLVNARVCRGPSVFHLWTSMNVFSTKIVVPAKLDK